MLAKRNLVLGSWIIPLDVVLVSVIYLLLVSLYHHIVPPLEGFDSIAHYNYINYLGQQRQLPRIDNETARISYELVQQPPLYYALSAIATIGSPHEKAQEFARSSENPYLQKGLSQRWSVTLPDVSSGVQRSMWISRLMSTLGGLLAVVGTWLLVRELMPSQRSMATVVACIVGLNPLFLFISSTITNDAWVVAGTTITLWLVSRTAKLEGFSSLRWLLVGCAAGVASLTKYSALLIAGPSLLVVARYAKKTGYVRVACAGLMVLVGVLLTAGFWYLRNLALYDQLVPFQQMTTAIPTFLRALPMGFAEVWDKLPWLFYSYWGVFVGIFAPVSYYRLLKWFVFIGTLGLPVSLVVRRDVDKPNTLFVVLLCIIWFLAAFLSLINWMRLVVFGEQARLLLTASPAIAILLVLGWQAFVPRRWFSKLHLSLSVLFILVALLPLPTLVKSYAVPKSLPTPVSYDRPVLATFDGGMSVMGIDLPEGATVAQAAELPLTVYFKAEKEITEDYTLFIHLIDDEQDLYHFDGVPFQGRHPTRQWTPGAVFADSYRIVVNPEAQINDGLLATLTLGFYNYRDGNRVAVFDQNGLPAGDRLNLAKLRILTEPPSVQEIPSPPVAGWKNGINLVSIDLEEDIATGSYSVELQWQASLPIYNDYTVFLQLLDPDDRVLAQVDQQPLNGDLPTSTWLPGEIIQDRYRLEVPSANWSRMVLGFYDHVTGERLLLERPSQGQDHFVVLYNG